MTVKSGPKGHALWTSYLDLLTIPDSLKESLGVVGGPKLIKAMSNYLDFIPYIQKYLDNFPVKTGTALRRLAVIQDKEGKNREIAILDYYTQLALEPLHNVLFKVIKRIPQDCTFDHGKLLETFVPVDGSSYHSIDLSSATDRFPIQLQGLLLEVLYGKEYSEHWENVMVGYPFDYKGESITYARGNPMGAYSSWSAFVLAHHFLVYLACKEAKVNWKKCRYMMLGDDIVIADDKVAHAYIGILQRFDIPFSKEKSHQSPYLFEFAKRFVHDGTEISPFPLAGIFENRNNWLLAIGTIFEEARRKRWEPRIDILHSAIGYMKAIGYSSGFVQSKADKLESILLLRDAFAGRESIAHALKRMAFLLHGKDFAETISFFHSQFLVSEVLTKAFQRIHASALARINTRAKTKPLGDIALQLMMSSMMLLGRFENTSLLVESCPLIQVFNDVEVLYRRLRHSPMNDNALMKGDFRNFLIQANIPVGDESFYLRRKDALVLVTSRLVDQIEVIMGEIKRNPSILHPMAW
jgi:hypothetical protein